MPASTRGGDLAHLNRYDNEEHKMKLQRNFEKWNKKWQNTERNTKLKVSNRYGSQTYRSSNG